MTKSGKRDNHEWTKSDIKKICDLWKTKTTKEICAELDISYVQLMYMRAQMTKAGFALPRKRKNGYLQSLLKECLSEVR